MEATRAGFVNHPATPANGGVQASFASRIVDWPGADQVASPAGGIGDHHRQVVAVPLHDLELAGQEALVRGFMNFKNSAVPSRVMFFAGDAWNDFPATVVEALREGFAAGKAIVDVPVGDSLCLFDFVRMLQIDAATNDQNSIAWIDVNGRCFFPRRFTERGVVGPKLEIEVRIADNCGAVPSGQLLERRRPPLEPLEERSDESQVVSVAGGLERQMWAGLQVLDAGNRFYKIVENLFLGGMRRFAQATRITSIRRCVGAGPSENGRLRSFMTQVEMTRAARGAANVKLGWYGTSSSGVTSVIRHGFKQPNNRLLGPQAQAVGVYLAPLNSPHASSLLSEADDDGEKHVILCRIIIGNAEKVDTRSPQFRPSGDQFDCGMDDLEKPSWYILWTSHMDTHILPEYIVSFKTSGLGQERSRAKETSGEGKSTKIALSFPKLFAEMGNCLPSSRMQALEIIYDRFKARKISKDIFIKNLRTLAGDKLLLTTIKKCHNCL